MLTAKRIEAQVALLPLLRRRVDVVRFALIEPTISLETDGKGNGNWQIGGASGRGGGAARSPSGLAFGDLYDQQRHDDLSRWRDRQGDQHRDRNAVAARARSAVADQCAIPRQGGRHRRLGRGRSGTARRAAAASLAVSGDAAGRRQRAEGLGEDEDEHQRRQDRPRGDDGADGCEHHHRRCGHRCSRRRATS